MKLRYFCLIMFLCLFNYSYSCKYEPHNREQMVAKGLKEYDLVFYGELIELDTVSGNFTFKILELFKGESKTFLIHGSYGNECTVLPEKKELWIVYANYTKNYGTNTNKKSITINMSSPSMGLESFLGGYPPPPPYFEMKNTELKKLYEKVHLLEAKNQNLIDWIQQLEKLRIYKASQNIIIEKQLSDQKTETYNRYIIISLIVNIILFLILIFVLLKKKINRNIGDF